jgi:predicted ATPase
MYGDLETCERRSAELIAYCAEKTLAPWRMYGALCQGSARAIREPTQENIAILRAAIDAHRRAGSRLGNSIYESLLAEALLGAGDVAGAEAAVRETFTFVEESGERSWLANLHRIEGRIALARPEPDKPRAEACLLQAIDIARQQSARMLELRAATDLARLWRDSGSNNDPRALLEPILETIEGGEKLRHVREARALLAELV